MIKVKNEKGITLVALVVTIIVLLILAAVSINLVLGDNGIVARSKNAVKETNYKSELEKVQLAVVSAGIGTDGKRELTKGNLQESLDNEMGAGVANVSESQEDGYIITIGENEYTAEKNGSVEKDETEQVVDANPGEFAGNGTESDPYLIESIEDLVALSTNVNGGESYLDKFFKLTKTLNFSSIKSYVNYQTKYLYNEEAGGYELDDSGEEIKTLCTTGEGFITIGRKNVFEGNFLGNNCSIRNLYINISEESSYTNAEIGLFGMIQNDKIENLSVTGKIIAISRYIGGIAGYAKNHDIAVIVKNCNSDVDIICTGNGYVAGIVGCMYGTMENCTNTGKIEIESKTEYMYAGGIAGFASKSFRGSDAAEKISGCINKGEIKIINIGKYPGGDLAVGGIVGYNNGTTIENSINYANIYGKCEENKVSIGGISGYNDTFTGYTATVNNCENKGDLTGISSKKNVYMGGIVGYAESGSIAEDNVNSGRLDATAEQGTVYKNDIVGIVQ